MHLLARATALVFLPVAATAQTPTIVHQFGVPPTGTAFVGGVDYDPINDTIWTVDQTNDLIHRFDRVGNLLLTFPAPIAPGTTANPLPIGAAVDPTTGNLWIVDEAEIVYELRPDGSPTGASFRTTPTIVDASGLAFDPEARTLFVSQDSGTRAIGEFTLSGVVVQSILIGAAGSTDADGLAYNPVNRHFYLGEDTGDLILELDRQGNLVRSIALGTLAISPEGLGIDTRTGSIFIGDGFATRRVFEVTGIVPACTGSVTRFGAACNDSSGQSPRLDLSDCPTGGRTATIAVTLGSSVTAPAVFFFGFQQLGIPLDFLGATGCFLHTTSEYSIATLGSSGTRAGFTIAIPGGPGIAGQSGNLQALLIGDLGANPAGVVGSNGLRFVLQ
jgi:sugar lactone lactonase YvrE